MKWILGILISLFIFGSWAYFDYLERYRIVQRFRQLKYEVITKSDAPSLLKPYIFDVISVDSYMEKFGDESMRDLRELNEVQTIHIESSALTDKHIDTIQYLTELKTLDIRAEHITDAVVANLEHHDKLTKIILYATPISDIGLSHIERISTLEKLYLTGSTNLTDTGMSNIANMKSLTHLILWSNNVTDEGISRLALKSNWNELTLWEMDITDQCIKYFSKMTSLKVLKLIDTNITPEGLGGLKTLLPSCEVTLQTSK